MEFQNKDRIDQLRQLLFDKLTPLITGDYVLLDVPNYRNIGDNLIWKGEKEFLKKIPYKCNYSCNLYTYNSNKISQNDIILLQGGGNFGDMYPQVNNFRLKVMSDFPENKIIILPQTIFYQNPKTLYKDVQVFKKQKNLFICVRDTESYNLLAKQGLTEKLLLLPDMAFCLDFTEFHSKIKTGKCLYFKRIDTELKTSFNQDKVYLYLNTKEMDIKDWPSYSSSKLINHFLFRLDGLKVRLSQMLLKMDMFSSFVDSEFGLNPKSNMDSYINNGIKFVNSYDKICTTRLHGFILCLLLNKEVAIVDNSYGKNFNFYNTWLKDFEKVKLLS